MTLGAVPQISDIMGELDQALPYTFPDNRTRWLAEVGASAPLVFPTSFANKQSVKVVASFSDAGGSSPHTFSGLNFGLDFSDRVLIACTIMHGAGASAMIISGLTIGGVAATGNNSGEFGGSGPSVGAGMYAAAVPTGQSGDVVVTWSGQSSDAMGIILLSVAKISQTQFDKYAPTLSGTPASSVNGTLNVPSNGVLVGVVAHAGNDATTWTGLTGRASLQLGTSAAIMSVAYDNRLASATPASVTANWTNSHLYGVEYRSYTQ